MDIQTVIERALGYVSAQLLWFLGVLIVLQVVLFFVPGGVLWFRLRGLKSRVKGVGQSSGVTEPGRRMNEGGMPQLVLDSLDRIFSAPSKNLFSRSVARVTGRSLLSHLWSEYRETLHLQYRVEDGQRVPSAVRATVPAEVYFNSQTVVDGSLRTELFKHFPGIFTGLGIIGTFSGLIHGLGKFEVSENPNTVRGSLQVLMHLVGDAFKVSASAILVAMVATFLIGVFLSALRRRTEGLAQAIDAHFDAGAGADYLSRITDASERSATEVGTLKDSLISDLKSILQELSANQIQAAQQQQTHLVEQLNNVAARQVDAANQNSQSLSETITSSIRDGLHDPMQRIAETVREASGDQSASAARMLQDVMCGFSQKLSDLFGGQISGLSELNQQTARGVGDAVDALKTLVSDMKAAGQSSADAMAARMAQAIEKMEARQESINAQTAAFVGQIRQLVESSQSATQDKLQETLGALGGQLESMLNRLGESQSGLMARNEQQGEAIAQRMQEAVDRLSVAMEAAVTSMRQLVESAQSETSSSLQKTLSSVGDQLTDMLDKLGKSQASVAESTQKHGEVMAAQAAGLVGSLNERVQAAVAGVSGQMEAAMSGISATMNHTVGDLTSSVQATVQGMSSQVEGAVRGLSDEMQVAMQGASRQVEAVVNGISSHVTSVMGTMSEEVGRSLSDVSTRIISSVEAMSKQMNESVQRITGSVDAAVRGMDGVSQRLVANTDTLGSVAVNAAGRMQSGAEQLAAASHDFAQAGNAVSGVMKQAVEVSGHMGGTAQALKEGAGSITELLADYRDQRSSMDATHIVLQAAIEAARREASVTEQILARIEGSAQRLAVAQRQADEYLNGVTRVLGDAHEAFAESVVKTLERANGDFHKKLSSAVNMLRGSIEDLDTALSTASFSGASRK